MADPSPRILISPFHPTLTSDMSTHDARQLHRQLWQMNDVRECQGHYHRDPGHEAQMAEKRQQLLERMATLMELKAIKARMEQHDSEQAATTGQVEEGDEMQMQNEDATARAEEGQLGDESCDAVGTEQDERSGPAEQLVCGQGERPCKRLALARQHRRPLRMGGGDYGATKTRTRGGYHQLP